MSAREWRRLAALAVVAVVTMFAPWGGVLALAWAFDAVTL